MRFRLRHILIVTALIAAYLGFVEQRRQWILKEYAALRKAGVQIEPISGIWWPEVPAHGIVVFFLEGDRLVKEHVNYNVEDAKIESEMLLNRMSEIGVEKPYIVVYPGSHRGADSHFHVDGLELYRMVTKF